MSMKKRIISFLLAGAVLLTSAEGSYQWNTVSAASQIRVSRTNVTVAKGAKVTVKAKNTGSRKIKAKISDRRIISVKITKKQIRITGRKRGRANITLTASRMKKCVIKVSVKSKRSERADNTVTQSTRQPLPSMPVKPGETPMIKYTIQPPVKTAETAVTAKPQRSLRPPVASAGTQTASPSGEKNPTKEPAATRQPVAPFTETPVTKQPAAPFTETPVTKQPAAPFTETPVTKQPAAPFTETPVTAQPAVPSTETPVTAQPEAPSTETPVTALSTTRLLIADRSIYIGESVNALKAAWGEPDRTDPLPQQNITGYIYNSYSTTAPYMLVGIRDEKVVSYFTIAKDFIAYDAKINPQDNTIIQETTLVQEGTSAAEMVNEGWEEAGEYEFDALDSNQKEKRVGTEAYYRLTDNAHVYAFTDYFGTEKKPIYGFYAFSSKDCSFYEMMYRSRMTYDDAVFQALEKQIWEITNAYRRYMGLSMLLWEDKAVQTAKKHSQDMADNSYFSHYSQNGSKPGERLNQNGISWKSYCENICAGSGDAISMTIGWIGSSGHRKNILNDMTYLGVGVGYNQSDTLKYYIYATQDFWR